MNVEATPTLAGGVYTKISWADLTFNGWWGCVKVSPACRWCYAENTSSRWGHDVWGKKKPRRLFGPKHWAEPERWHRHDAVKVGRSLTVFCGSMMDVFEDHPMLPPERAKLWPLIKRTPNLRWMLTTKRPENAERMVPEHWMADGWPAHVWLLVSTETQRFADERIPVVRDLPVRGVRGISCEPLLEPLDVADYLGVDGVDWVIAGGGSGRDHRRTELDWFRSLRDQADRAHVPFHLKQLGQELAKDLGARGKGDDPAYWPIDLRRQDMPPLGRLVPETRQGRTTP